ncbi:predicted protein [Sclerotinia sclerotiorum 1980 UF-70]|uniref:Uncharacterized protein n=1 Tax=Sclerotinia sclerotiorum (strain ATCC 18683 / 1980 / Ss-1) TaxID=665079 RepID=A7F767_SCLS1|nr:predicted protein [Sclerotinia sclerotiorum 1980 UF-70]EDN98588.1 predicted protein [Sclerotinia sclerotiorum 1980 UF-70]
MALSFVVAEFLMAEQYRLSSEIVMKNEVSKVPRDFWDAIGVSDVGCMDLKQYEYREIFNLALILGYTKKVLSSMRQGRKVCVQVMRALWGSLDVKVMNGDEKSQAKTLDRQDKIDRPGDAETQRGGKIQEE